MTVSARRSEGRRAEPAAGPGGATQPVPPTPAPPAPLTSSPGAVTSSLTSSREFPHTVAQLAPPTAPMHGGVQSKSWGAALVTTTTPNLPPDVLVLFLQMRRRKRARNRTGFFQMRKILCQRLMGVSSQNPLELSYVAAGHPLEAETHPAYLTWGASTVLSHLFVSPHCHLQSCVLAGIRRFTHWPICQQTAC